MAYLKNWISEWLMVKIKRKITTVFCFAASFMVMTLLTTGCHKQQPVPESESPPALLFAAKCNICHPAYHPLTHTSTGWANVVPRMEKNAETMGMGSLLSDDERSIILGYLEKHARKGF